MFETFIVFLWLEWEGKLYIRPALPLQRTCNYTTWLNVQKQYKHDYVNIVAMKCGSWHDYKEWRKHHDKK
jgi:hypothetical protein